MSMFDNVLNDKELKEANIPNDLEEGDILEFTGTNSYKEKISHITENYLFHYAYLPNSAYENDTYNMRKNNIELLIIPYS